ncbi:MAG: hypothetical protein HND53_03010 [Proteobacteria bacterium]|nr:hypothetical protein [Pseudomonadota bacterium]NOG59441.1 hypothetical protein [Pseudomonadota bacterium]
MHLKNKQRKIASITLSFFMGSWLLLLCQTCFATNDNIKSHHESSDETPVSCHIPENIALEEINIIDDDRCLGVCDCDCDAMTITFSSDKNSELKEKTKYSSDLYSYISLEIIISTRAPPGYRIFTIPERAIFLPLQTYNVLLI